MMIYELRIYKFGGWVLLFNTPPVAKYSNCTLYIVNCKSIFLTSSLVFRSSYILIRHSSNNACVAGVRIVEWAHEQT